MRFVDTIWPLLFASLCALIVILGAIAFQGAPPRGTVWFLVALWIWPFVRLAEALFVVPVMLFVPRLRRPPLWLAALWAVGAEVASAMLIFRTIQPVALGFGVPGAISGVAYALAARSKTAARPDR